MAKRGRVSRIALRLVYPQPGTANSPSQLLTGRVPCGPTWNNALEDAEVVLRPLAEQQLAGQHLRVPPLENLLPPPYHGNAGLASRAAALQEQSAEEQRSMSFTGETRQNLPCPLPVQTLLLLPYSVLKRWSSLFLLQDPQITASTACSRHDPANEVHGRGLRTAETQTISRFGSQQPS